MVKQRCYQGYMLLHYQAALIQSEVERRRTQEEYQRAQEEYQRAEQEAVARRMAEVQAAAATQAQQIAEAEIIQLRAELARLRAATP